VENGADIEDAKSGGGEFEDRIHAKVGAIFGKDVEQVDTRLVSGLATGLTR
jgi:hypothetical protein